MLVALGLIMMLCPTYSIERRGLDVLDTLLVYVKLNHYSSDMYMSCTYLYNNIYTIYFTTQVALNNYPHLHMK